MDASNSMKLKPQLVLGLIAIGLGVLFILDNLNLLHLGWAWNVGEVWRYWPALLIIAGLVQILRACCTGHLVIGVILTIAGGVMFPYLSYLRYQISDFWPLILVAVGANVVWRTLGGGRRTATDSSDIVNGFALLSGVVRTCNSQDFRGGELTAIMGGCEVDLRQASIIDGKATIQVLALWGGIEIKVPEDWNVRSSVAPLLGGFEDRTRPPMDGSGKTLHVRGAAIMGGIEVHN